jgi:glutaconate CoA-transferase, subunit A
LTKKVDGKVMPLAEALGRHLVDGQTVALEGFTHLIPFAAAHEILRQGVSDLTLVRMTPDVIYDQLIGMGVARKLIFSYGGNPGVGSLHRFRDAIEKGWPRPLDLEEHSHAGLANAYAAGAANLPFAVLRGYAGTGLAARTGSVATIECPFTRGNVMFWGISGVQKEAVLAAKNAVVTVEEIVPQLIPRPHATVLPSWVLSAVSVVPNGAWPSYAAGYSVRDNHFYSTWDEISRDRDRFTSWINANVLDVLDEPAAAAT